MYNVETHNNCKEYYKQLVVESDSVYITANISLSYMIKEVSKVSKEDGWRVIDIENFINNLYPNWTDTINSVKLKSELRKSIYKVREFIKSKEELEELRFLEDNISVVYSDFRYLAEAGITELTYETSDIKLKLIKDIFNIFSKTNLFKEISREILNINKVRNFPEKLIENHLANISKFDENKAKVTRRIINSKNNNIKKIYFFNISNLDLRRYLVAEILKYAGFEVTFVIPYFKSLNVVNKCWNMVYGDKNLFHININEEYCLPKKDKLKYINFLEGKEVADCIEEKIFIKNYKEVYDFKKKIKGKKVITLYKDSLKSIMQRDSLNIKGHCYQNSIGRFLFNLYECRVYKNEIKMDFDTYTELITSGWIEYKGWNGLRLHSYLIDNADYFAGVTTLDEIITRIDKLREAKDASDIFYEQSKDRIKRSQTKKFLSNPFKAFGYLDFEKYKITVNNIWEVTLRLKRFLLKVFESENGLINIEEHFNLLMILYRNKYIIDLYKNGSEEQKNITRRIYAVLSNPKEFGVELHRDELIELFNVKLVLDRKQIDQQEEDFSVDQLEGVIFRDKLLKSNNGTLYLGDMSYKAYEKYVEKLKEFNKILSFNDFKYIFQNNLKGKSRDIVLQGINLQENSRKAGESYFKFALANLIINYDDNIEFSWIEGLRKDDNKAIFLKQIESLYGRAKDEVQSLNDINFVKEKDMNFDFIADYDKKNIISNVNSVPEVAFRDLDFCGDKFLYSSILEGNPVYYSDFHHKLAFSVLVSIFKNNIEDGYVNILKFVLPLFPQWNDVVKKNILDCEFSRKGLREYRYFEGINYPKAMDALYLLKSKYIVTKNNKIRNRYNKGEFNGERYYKEFIEEFLDGKQNNRGLHCRMCPHNYLCKKGEFVIDSK